MGLHLQQAHNEQVNPALERPLLCRPPLPAMLIALQLGLHAALGLLPHAAHICAQGGICDCCKDTTAVNTHIISATPVDR